MRRLLAALLLVASPALAQENGWQEIQNGWGEIQTALGSYSTMPAPTGCVATSVPIFLGSPVAMGCDAGLTYDAATDTLTVGGAIRSGVNIYAFNAVFAQQMQVDSAGAFNFSSTLVDDWTPDSGLRRVSAGLVGVTDGSTGNGALQAAGFKALTGSRPTADAASAGMIWYVAGGTGVADTIEICVKQSSDAYAWVALATVP